MTPDIETAAGAAERFAEVEARIAAAAKEAGRDPGSARLIAVSKTL